MYAVPYIAPSHSANIVYGPLQTTKGKIYHAPGEITTGYPTVPIGSKSGHIKAKSISCGSCSKLKSEQKNLGCSGAGKGFKLLKNQINLSSLHYTEWLNRTPCCRWYYYSKTCSCEKCICIM